MPEKLLKAKVKSLLESKEYSLRKRDVRIEDVDNKKVSPIWLYVSDIFPCKHGEEIPKKMKPVRGFVCEPDGVILIKSTGTTSIMNYLSSCKEIKVEERLK